VFIDVLSRAFLNTCCDRESSSSRYGASSPDGVTVALRHSPGGDKSTDAPPSESLANQREWSVVITVLDRVCFTASVTAVVVAILIFFPRWLASVTSPGSALIIHFIWPHFIWTTCAMFSRSHCALGRFTKSQCTIQFAMAVTSHCALRSNEISSDKMRWNEMSIMNAPLIDLSVYAVFQKSDDIFFDDSITN